MENDLASQLYYNNLVLLQVFLSVFIPTFAGGKIPIKKLAPLPGIEFKLIFVYHILN